METKDYLRALKRLKLTPHSKRTAAALGLSVPSIQRIAAKTVKVSGPIERLLAMYLKYGLPKEYRE